MKITEFLSPQAVIPELRGRTKQDILRELAEGLATAYPPLAGLPRLYASFGVARAGVDFSSIDGRPTQLFFALVAPENSAGIHLKALARISRLFRNPQFREAILQAPDAGRVYSLIAEEDARA
jgi:PTS system nitrogen regulatory IIA component